MINVQYGRLWLGVAAMPYRARENTRARGEKMMSIALPADNHDDIGDRAVSEYRKWRQETLEGGTTEDVESSIPDGKAEPGNPGPATSH